MNSNSCGYVGCAILFLSVLLSACGVGPDERMENPSDPLSSCYAPVAPKYLYADVISDTVVNIQWYEEAVGEHGFHLYRNSDLDTMFRLIAVIPRGTNWYSDVGEHESSLFVDT